MIKKAIVECNPDEILMQVLGLSKKEIVHQDNKGEVCKYLEKFDTKVAIIDEDPGSAQPNHLKKFKLVEEKFETIKLIQANTSKVILIIKPRLEEWVIYQCKRSGINPNKFHLPDTAKELKKVINYRLERFRELLKELYKSENEGLKYLRDEINQAY
ncbi:hypothetical protein A4H97_28780 [Niastella yeongjuensis]|uniref:Uncharacterized protein n=1 Tax=Niastella yeongjuensis TaxID=354355 RepID=A0A1V9ET46_9BACT|nr:hypothetical protein [Niastella yeongjuensis]OQP49337.1 hypothetical protein A4H97_28780 [Niastella yeongjuensis]SEP43392.1 hypothetical protein SAMN05660816_06097 [Niastella yeongjuensis]